MKRCESCTKTKLQNVLGQRLMLTYDGRPHPQCLDCWQAQGGGSRESDKEQRRRYAAEIYYSTLELAGRRPRSGNGFDLGPGWKSADPEYLADVLKEVEEMRRLNERHFCGRKSSFAGMTETELFSEFESVKKRVNSVV
jgi:hypothetical protein